MALVYLAKADSDIWNGANWKNDEKPILNPDESKGFLTIHNAYSNLLRQK